MYSIGGEAEECWGLVVCEWGGIDVDEEKTIDKASPFPVRVEKPGYGNLRAYKPMEQW